MAANNLGTAYIKIAPQMQGIQSSISNAIKGATKSGSSVSTAAIAVGNVISKGISVAMNAVTSSVDAAIRRTDILNNFPKVMSNMGISAEESQKSISKLVEKLDGLPTSLQDGAAAVQRFTSRNNDIQKSTQIFLALNNALLAGGMSTEQQATALEQLSQAYAKGKPDMMEWRSMQQAMPAQLNQISKKMLGNKDALEAYMKKAQDYADKNPMSSIGKEMVEQLDAVKKGTGDMTTALGTAMRAGVISMDEFMNTIIELNENGSDGFKSFEEQARNSTDGIGTAMTNVRNRIAAALQKIINAFGSKDIAEAINKFSSNFGKVADWIVENIVPVIKDKVIPAIKNVLAAIGNVVEFIKQNEWVQNTIMGIVSAMLAFKAVSAVKNVITGVISPIISLTKNLATGVGAFKSAMDAGLTFGSAMGNVASSTTGITSKIAGLGQTLTTTHGAVGGLTSKLLGISSIAGGVVLAVEGIKAMIEINKIQTIEATTAAREYAREHYNVAQAAESAKRAQDLLKQSTLELKDAQAASTDAEIRAIEARKNQTYYLNEMNRLKSEGKQKTDEYRLAELNYTKAIREEELANEDLSKAQEEVKTKKEEIDNLNSSNLYRGNLILGSILREKQEYGNLALQLDELKNKTLKYRDEQGNMVESSLQKSQEMVEGLAQQLAQGDATWAAIVDKANQEGISFAEACAKYGAEGGSGLIGNFKSNAEFNLPLVSEVGQETVDRVSDSLQSIATTGKTIGASSSTEFAGGIRSKIEAVVEAARKMGQSAVDSAKAVGGAYNVGQNLTQGAADGTQNRGALNNLLSNAKSAIVSAIAAMRKAAQEHSPSKETAEIGKFMSLGLAKGIDDYAEEAIESAENMTKRTIDAMNADYNPNLSMSQLQPQTALTGSQNGSQGQVIQYNDFTVDSELDVKEISKRLGWQVATAL